MSEKMKWTTPQLIVLARGTPEEAVLTHCKVIGPPTQQAGPSVLVQSECSRGPDQSQCGSCQSRSGS